MAGTSNQTTFFNFQRVDGLNKAVLLLTPVEISGLERYKSQAVPRPALQTLWEWYLVSAKAKFYSSTAECAEWLGHQLTEGFINALFVQDFTYLLYHLLSQTNLVAYRLWLDQMIDPNTLYSARRDDGIFFPIPASKVLADAIVRAHRVCSGSTCYPPFRPADVEVHPGFRRSSSTGSG